MSNIKEYIVAPRQLQTLKQSGMDETQRKKFAQRVVSLVMNNPLIQDAQPMSVFNVALKMETLKVSPELETAYMVPYNTKQGKVAQFQMGYKGYVELAMRTGLYNKIDCVEVKESDYVDYNIDTDTYTWREDKLSFQDTINRKKEPTIGYRAFAIQKDGTKEEMFMTMDEINNHHNEYSKAYKFKDKFGNVFNGASKNAMDRKVVLKLFINRKLVKRMDVDASSMLREALQIDSAVLQGEDGQRIAYVDNPSSKDNQKIMTDEPKVFDHKSGATSINYSNVDMDLTDITFEEQEQPIEHTSGNQEQVKNNSTGLYEDWKPSSKQFYVLTENGYTPEQIETMSKEEVSSTIGKIYGKE